MPRHGDLHRNGIKIGSKVMEKVYYRFKKDTSTTCETPLQYVDELIAKGDIYLNFGTWMIKKKDYTSYVRNGVLVTPTPRAEKAAKLAQKTPAPTPAVTYTPPQDLKPYVYQSSNELPVKLIHSDDPLKKFNFHFPHFVVLVGGKESSDSSFDTDSTTDSQDGMDSPD